MECAKEEKRWLARWWLVLRVHGDPWLFLLVGTLAQALALHMAHVDFCAALSLPIIFTHQVVMKPFL